MGGIGIWQLLIIAVIVVLLFGTKKLRNLGGDLGSAIKGFKNAVSEEKPTDVVTKETTENLTNNTTTSEKSDQKETQKDNSQA